MLTDYCVQQSIPIYKIYVDDGYSGLNFQRPGFQELLEDVEKGLVNLVITKDLSRLGRDYIMTGYYSEIYFQAKGVRYIAMADNIDSLKGTNEIAPFKNILNEMYARDISKKIKNAKRQYAKQGRFIGSQPPFGYVKDKTARQLIVDPEAAETVRTIFSLAQTGLGSVAIAHELEKRNILAPSVYKYRHGDQRFANHPAVVKGDDYSWCTTTISQILSNDVYTGILRSLKTETQNCKTKKKKPVPKDRQIITQDAHEAIVSKELLDSVQKIRATHVCPAKMTHENIFRGKLFCECCGHPLSISRKELLDGKKELYICMYHYAHPDVCPKTHRVYHDFLYGYVLQQIHQFARSMKRRNTKLPIRDYIAVEQLTPEIINDVIDRIEVSHVTRKSKPANVIQIYWK